MGIGLERCRGAESRRWIIRPPWTEQGVNEVERFRHGKAITSYLLMMPWGRLARHVGGEKRLDLVLGGADQEVVGGEQG